MTHQMLTFPQTININGGDRLECHADGTIVNLDNGDQRRLVAEAERPRVQIERAVGNTPACLRVQARRWVDHKSQTHYIVWLTLYYPGWDGVGRDLVPLGDLYGCGHADDFQKLTVSHLHDLGVIDNPQLSLKAVLCAICCELAESVYDVRRKCDLDPFGTATSIPAV